MTKIFNWIFGSFFRTLGRILVFILLGFILFNIVDFDKIKLPNLFSIMNVNAEVQPFGKNLSVQFWGDSGLTQVINFSGSPSQSSSTIHIYNYAGITYNDYVYLLVAGCRHGSDISASVSARNSSGIIGQVKVYNSEEVCNDGYDGKITYLQYQVSTWADLDNTGEELYVTANSTIYGNNYMYIMNKYFSNQDVITSLIQGKLNYDKINSSINNSKNDIIDNQNQNKNDIINNQNSNTDKQIDSQRVCQYIDKKNIIIDNKYLNAQGQVGDLSNFGITDYISIQSSSIKNIVTYTQAWEIYSCYYNTNKELISCFKNQDMTNTIPLNASYIKLTINKSLNKPQFELCQNGNQAISGGLNDINGSLNNSDTTEATNDANNFFNDFTTDLHGLSGIITAPLNAINSLSNKTCSPLVLPLPFVDKDLTLPCMRSIYDEHFGAFMTLYDTITFGIVSYWVCVRIFSFVKDFKNPEHDEIEVVDL